MSSGVAVDKRVVSIFKEIMGRQCGGAVFKINDEMTAVEVEKKTAVGTGSAKSNWEAFTKTLPESDCRYISFDFAYEHQGTTKNRVVFLLWSPETARIKSKMIYAASQEGVVNMLEGIQRSLQVTDRDELDYSFIAKKLAQHTAGY